MVSVVRANLPVFNNFFNSADSLFDTPVAQLAWHLLSRRIQSVLCKSELDLPKMIWLCPLYPRYPLSGSANLSLGTEVEHSYTYYCHRQVSRFNFKASRFKLPASGFRPGPPFFTTCILLSCRFFLIPCFSTQLPSPKVTKFCSLSTCCPLRPQASVLEGPLVNPDA